MINIQELLDKYWDGESSLEDEKILKEYFVSGEIAPEHEAFRDLFVFFDDSSKTQYNGVETELPVELLNSENFPHKSAGKNNVLVLTRRWIAVAALFTLLISVVILIKNQSSLSTQSKYVYEVEDPEEAMEITLKALAMVSGKLDKGTTAIMNGLQNVEKADILR